MSNPIETPSSCRATIVIPVLNESASIEACLRSVMGQTTADIEILVADGGSADDTRDIVDRLRQSDPRIRLIDNPGRIQAAGLNRCLAEARAPTLVRLDGHAHIDPDYVARSLEISDSTGAEVVGGRMVPVTGHGVWERAIGMANERSWGAGPARFHGGTKAGPSETVYLGVIRTAAARAAGGWAEDVGVNEDYEFNHRIRAGGGTVWFDPSLSVSYRPRRTLREVERQYRRYGRSKATVMLRHRRSVRLRQLIPMAIAPALLGCLAPGLGRTTRTGCRLFVATWLAGVAAGAATASGQRSVRARAAAVAVIMHTSWSVGVWQGVLGRAFPRSS